MIENEIRLLTAGPTRMSYAVKKAMINGNQYFSDNTSYFNDLYSLSNNMASYLNCSGQVFILPFSATLAIESVISSLIDKDDCVLCISNGFFGDQLYKVSCLYSSNVKYLHFSEDEDIDISYFDKCIKQTNVQFRFMTVVHCETSTGKLNDIHSIAEWCKINNIILIIDAVSSLFAEEVLMDVLSQTIIIAGSQKVLSAPIGYSIVIIQNDNYLKGKRKNLNYSLNLFNHIDAIKEKDVIFSPAMSSFNGLVKAFDEIESIDKMISKHNQISIYTRSLANENGLSTYINNNFSHTVTAIELPYGVNAKCVINFVQNNVGILLSGTIGKEKKQVVRIGHMGRNCDKEDIKSAILSMKEAVVNLTNFL